jgi:hypothetical protein
MYKYRHSKDSKTVYRYPKELIITEQRNKQGKRIGWEVGMQIDITRADNILNRNQWKYPTSDYPTQQFDAHYQRPQVISYFLMRHEPSGDDITQPEYDLLRKKYEDR